ncbi:MAG: flippase-like domain-containing protein [Candidatus Omnitrophica bacterium]|nr:flippase-like domain-containing protein [Candidatus Omnitrophota bacterium]
MVFKKAFFIFLRISISILLLIILFNQIQIKDMLKLLKNTKILVLLFSFSIFLLSYFLCFLRWSMLLKAISIRVSLSRLFVSFCAGVFFNLFLPSTIGGDLVRTLDLTTHTQKSKEVLATVILDRLSGYIGLVSVAIIAVLWGLRLIKQREVFILIGIMTLFLIALLLFLFNKTVYSKINNLFKDSNTGVKHYLKNLYEQIHSFKSYRKTILANLLLSFLIQLLCSLTFYLLGVSLGIKINFIYFFILIPIISVITLIPVSMGGLGLREASTLYFFNPLGLNKDVTFAIALLNSGFGLIVSIAGGIIYVFGLHYRRI